MQNNKLNGIKKLILTRCEIKQPVHVGLSKIVGLHIRNDRFLANPASEIMFQFLILKSKYGKSGFAPIIEFEIPTHKGEKHINTSLGIYDSVNSLG